MKHIKLITTLLFIMATMTCHAYDYLLNGVYYNLNVAESTATVTNSGSYGSYSGTITIPETIAGPKGVEYDVVEIGENAFRNSTSMTSVTIASSIEKIDANAFYGCTGLTNVKVPNSILEIATGAFQCCSKLNQITLPKYITTLSSNLFNGCSALTDITIPTKVTTIESYAFSGCSKLASVNLPTSLTSIADFAFDSCSSLTNITIPSSVSTIGKYAFLSCTSLAEVAFSDGITSINEGAFKNCTSLKSISLPITLTNLGGYAFSGDNSLVSVNLNCNFRTLRTSTFYGCTSLTSITLPSSLESMMTQSLGNCTLLPQLTIPAKVTSIASDALSSCSGLKTIEFAQGMTNILRTYNTYINNVILPNSAITIADQAFYNCSKIVSISMPANLTTIGSQAFYGCTSLATVDLNKVQTIGTNAFYGCSALTEITLPAEIESIGTDAFANCNNLTSLIYPEGTTKALRTYATALNQVIIPSTCAEFADDIFAGCSKLTRVNISHLEMWNYIFSKRTSSPFSCAHTLYLNGQPLTDLLADFGTDVSSYAFYQTLGLKNVTIMNSTKGVADNAFSNCPDLESLVMGNGATYVGKNAFQGCSNLQSVKFGNSVRLIDNNAFYGCSKLQSVKMGGNESVIGENAFYGCSAVERITLPATVTSIGQSAFYQCKSLKKINIPEGISTINKNTFYQCTALNDVAMPEALTSVNAYAFYDCDHLVNMEFGDKLTTIGDYCFNNCDSLRYVHIGTGIKTIGSYAFSNCPQLVGFYINAVTPPTTQSTAFSGSDMQYASLYVPTEAVDTYKAKSPWSSFGNPAGLSSAPIYVKSISVEPNVLVMEDDGEGLFSATVYPENATNKKVTWTSKNTNIAYVASSGRVLAEGEGITTVTCKAKDGNGAVANCLVIINNDYKPLTSLTIDKDSMAMKEGDEVTITAALLPNDATYPEVLWTSTDDNVATVSSTGVVTAVEKGTCTITATANDGSNLLATCNVTVKEPTYASLALVGDVNSDGTLDESDIDALSDLLLGNHGGIDIEAYDMDKNGVVNIADIVYIIRCIKENKNKPAGQLKLVKLAASEYSMFTENSLALNPTTIPYNASVNLVWSSSNDSIASVDSTGIVTAKTPGTVTITAKANDGSGLSASCTITIEKNPYGYVDGYEYVDLGLPSGTRWATKNIGASKIEDYGNYYAWAETTTKDNYDWTNYKYCDGSATSLTKYCTATAYGTKDKLTVLETADDVAYTTMSSNWCLPTKAQFEELLNSENTTSKWTTQNGVAGYLVTSRYNNKSVFFPAAGYKNGKTATSVASGCYYPTKETADNSTYNYAANMGSSKVDTLCNIYRCYGQAARPVYSSYVQMSQTSMSLKIGSTASISAAYISNGEVSSKITWSSDDPSIATVDANGNIKAIADGTTYIRAKFDNGAVGFCKVNVYSHDYVDLGLPSGTLWATTNVGAENPEDAGLYFAWGETTGYTSDTSDGRSFYWDDYKWMTSGQSSGKGCTKYTFADGQTSGCWYSGSTYVGTTVNGVTYTNLRKLEAADDAATVNWGSGWCMPTHAQQVELVNSSYTTTTWTTKNGVKCRLITSKSNGNSIFLPAAGCRSYASLSDVGSCGRYWSSELYSSYSDVAWILYFDSSNVDTDYGNSRYCGRSVRAVRSQTANVVKVSNISLNTSSVSIKVGESYQLVATISPDNATYKTCSWQTSDKSIATVDENGNVTAVAAGTATVTVSANDSSGVTASCQITVVKADTHEYVDLGLPSGTLWATTNVGAENPEDAGLYFAWGETAGYTSDTSDGRSFNWASLKYCSGTTYKGPFTKYVTNSSYGTVDNKTELESEDDAATVNWGKDWCMPTHAQQVELINTSYTTTTWTTKNGVYGRLITSKTNGNSIFLPAAGCRYNAGIDDVGSYGSYWSSELYSDYSDDAWLLYFDSSNVGTDYRSSRCCGLSVRAVRSSASQN